MQLINITLAVHRMEAMCTFYTQLLGLTFQQQELYGTILYRADWNGMELLFCPAELAGNTATQNRHQLEISVPDIKQAVALALAHGGQSMGPITTNDKGKSAGVKDPDQNSLVLTQPG
ncbi:VOC family protein [Flavilitoribacter nigricans]|uniref:VOC domain-containing protein n=1 Tax=Flavilitoribacter nigricans (strain ATCC 23147 / DSM 23189 / NBRC 102662 / NCIMB 1420 / SS-2) TaxID=1122177 RepID=A0A2D0N356_FLAN2|nr:VOC family protein [Flavilitoribacter nigricans]PHN02840.1 hypothetical protein CRP01_30125 [Flavilitoribacter nigricans DSM 23189 = NBRC 102662]